MENLVESRALLDVPEWLEVALMGKEVELWSLWERGWSHGAYGEGSGAMKQSEDQANRRERTPW